MTVIVPNGSNKFDICLVATTLFNFACVTAQYLPPPYGYGRGGYGPPTPPYGPGGGGGGSQLVQSELIKVQGTGLRGFGSDPYPRYPSYPQPYPPSGPYPPPQSPYVSGPPMSPQIPVHFPRHNPYAYQQSPGRFDRPSYPPPSSYPSMSPYRPGYSYPPGYGSPQYPSSSYPPQPAPYYPSSWSRPQGDNWNEFDRRTGGGGGYPAPYPDFVYPRRPLNGYAKLKGPDSKVEGEVRFVQQDNRFVGITGRIAGLTPGAHGLHIFTNPKADDMCSNLGEHLNPMGAQHGGKSDWYRHTGDLGNVFADHDGVAYFDITDTLISLSGPNSVANRTLVVTERGDDLGKGSGDESKVNGSAGPPAACGTIMLMM